MRPCVIWLRTSQILLPSARHNGIPRASQTQETYILSDDLPVLAIKGLEPFADRLPPGGQFIESSWQSLHVLVPYILYQNWYQRASRKGAPARRLRGEPQPGAVMRSMPALPRSFAV